MGTSGNRDSQWASRSVLEDFTEDFHYLSRQFVSKCYSTNGESVLATEVATPLLVEFIACPRSPLLVRWVKVDSMGSSRRPWVLLNMDIRSQRIRRFVRENIQSCWRSASCWTCRSPFTNFRASFCTFSNASASRDRMGWDA